MLLMVSFSRNAVSGFSVSELRFFHRAPLSPSQALVKPKS